MGGWWVTDELTNWWTGMAEYRKCVKTIYSMHAQYRHRHRNSRANIKSRLVKYILKNMSKLIYSLPPTPKK